MMKEQRSWRVNHLIYAAGKDLHNTIRTRIAMTEPIDAEALRAAADSAITRYPYFSVLAGLKYTLLVVSFSWQINFTTKQDIPLLLIAECPVFFIGTCATAPFMKAAVPLFGQAVFPSPLYCMHSMVKSSNCSASFTKASTS